MNSVKRPLLITLFSLAGLFALISGIAFLKRDDIKNLVIKSINEKLDRKVDVGDISFYIWRNFPYASVEFDNVIIHESKEFVTTGHVLNAGKISLLFSLRSVFNEEYRLKKIVISDAALNLQIDKNGNNNYEIWKKTSSTKENSDSLHLELQDVVFENVDVLFYNQLKQQDLSFLIKKGSLNGDFKSEVYVLNSTAELENASIIIEKVKYLTSVDCGIMLSLQVDNKKDHYNFRESKLRLADLTLVLEGSIQNADEFLDLDLKISSPSADLPSLLSLIPEKYRSETIDYNYSGKVEFGGTIKGKSGVSSTPIIAFNFKSIGVNLNPKNTSYELRNMNGTGFFTNRKNKTNPVTYLRLENFSSTLEGKTIVVDLEVENFNKPKLKLSASAEADLKALSRFYKPDTLEEISGKIFADIKFNGITDEKSTYQSSGSVRFEDVNFKLKQKPIQFSNFNGLVHLRGNDVIAENIQGKTGNSDFLLNGSFNNLMAFLLLENQKLNGILSLSSNRIDLNELMAKDLKTTSANDTVYKINFPDYLKFQADLIINELTFNKFLATGIKGTITMESQVLTTRDLDFETAEGSVRLKGVIDNRPVKHLLINYDAIVKNLNINKLFTQMGNFGQSVLLAKNIKGRVSAEVLFRSSWSEKLEIDENSIYVKSNITIDNGELIDFEPMLELSKYLKGADLKSVKFSTLTNTIEIKNRKIFIPLMEIKSSALDITASGDHTFDNIVDYKLRLYLSQILGKKVKQQNTEFGTIEDDGLGRTMIHLSMKGPMADPKFDWDRKSVEKKISEEVKNETKTFKSLLKEEFGKKDPEKPAKSTNPENKKRDELQIDYDDEE